MPVSYARHQFPPAVSSTPSGSTSGSRSATGMSRSCWRWVLKFGPAIAGCLRRRRSRSTGHWHLDEMVVRIAGQHLYLWRAVDSEGAVLDILVQRRRDKAAASKLMRKLLKKQDLIIKTARAPCSSPGS
jgi:putative transposase